MFQVKVCGITNLDDAIVAAEAGADAIGLNFYSQSRRYIEAHVARQLTKDLRDRCGNAGPAVMGVFVNSSANEILATAATVDLDGVQLHGDEPPAMVAELVRLLATRAQDATASRSPRHISRALRCRQPDLSDVHDYLAQCLAMSGDDAAAATLPHSVLLDAYRPGEYGGTGQVVDWQCVRNQRDQLLNLPLVLAGGLTAENVAQAIATARPNAVDTASGVESSPGRKDAAKVRAFVAAARQAFAAIDGTN